MKINEIITELFNRGSAYPLTWGRASMGIIAVFSTEDASEIEVQFEKMSGGGIEVAFRRENKNKPYTHGYSITGGGDAPKILATVVSAIETYMSKYSPEYIIFTSEHPSRTKLYEAMVRRLIKSTNYHRISVQDIPHDTNAAEESKVLYCECMYKYGELFVLKIN